MPSTSTRSHVFWASIAMLNAGCTSPRPKLDPAECGAAPVRATPLRLLTRAEFNNTVADLLGPVGNVAKDFPREPLAHGLDNDADLRNVSGEGVTRYLEAAETLSTDVMTHRRYHLVPCTTNDGACRDSFLNSLGRRAFRRPLFDDELQALTRVFDAVSPVSGFDSAVQTVLQVVLQSPQFLYRHEQAVGTTNSSPANLSSYQLATRLSYFLWATTPDDALLNAAAAENLESPEGLAAEARRMLADARGIEGAKRFFDLWLYLDGVASTEKSTVAYPAFNQELADSWRRSIDLYVQDILSHEGTLNALLTSNVVYANNAMTLYGFDAPSSDFIRYEVSPGDRSGILAQPGFLAFKALPDGPSPVRRGMFVLDKLMCEPPPPPPAGVAITPPEPSATKTTRERFTAHSQDAQCRGCHQFIDPVGFAFERFDGMGLARDTENGVAINTEGAIVSAQDQSLIGPVANLGELSQKLARSNQVHQCIAKEMYRFAVGRALTDTDTCRIDAISKRFIESGGNFKALMMAIIESDAFGSHAPVEGAP